jgi:hypothetical protein
MKPQSAKAKGRLLQQRIRDMILQEFPELQEDDVTSRSMGAAGVDVLLSPKAQKVFPFSIEAKNQQALNVWSAMKQAESNAKNNIPLLVFHRNHSSIYACLPIEDLFKILKNETKTT